MKGEIVERGRSIEGDVKHRKVQKLIQKEKANEQTN